MASIAEINVRIGARIDKMVHGLKQAERELKKTGRKFTQMGENLTKSVSLPLAAIGGVSIKMSNDVQKSFSKIENLVGVTGDTLENFKDGVSKISGEVGKSQVELSNALFTITSAGLKGKEALELLEVSSKASVIGMGETGDIAKAATAIMQAYGKENVSAAEAVNLLTKTVREGNLEASELAPSIGKVIPLAAQMGISFQEVGANIATFTRLGVSASESVSGLKALLGNIIKPSKAAQETLAKYGLTIEGVRDSIAKNGLSATMQNLLKTFDGNVESASALFGSVEGLTNVLGTAGAQGEEYTKILASMNDGINVVDQGFEKVSETANQKFNKALVRLQNVSIEVGNVLLPIAADIAETIGTVAAKFAKLSGGMQKTIIAVAGLAAATGPMLKMYGTYKNLQASLIGLEIKRLAKLKALEGQALLTGKSITKMNFAMKATIAGAVIAATVALVAVYQNWNTEIKNTTELQNDLINVNTAAAQSIVEQKRKVENLAKAVNNETLEEGERLKALKALQEISPKYFSNLDLEKAKMGDVTRAVNGYVASIRKAAKAQAINENLVGLEKQLVDFKKIEEIRKAGEQQGANDNAGLLVDNDWDAYNRAIEKAGDVAVLTYKLDIDARIKALEKLIDAETLGIEETKSTFIDAENEKLKAALNRIEQLESRIKGMSTGSIGATGATSEKTDSGGGNNVIRDKVAAVAELATVTAWAKTENDLLNASYALSLEGMMAAAPVIETLQMQMERLANSINVSHQVMAAASQAMTQYAAAGGKSFADLGKSALKAAADVIRAKMQEAVASWIASNLKLGPAGLIIAAAGGAVIGTLFNKAISSLKIPALAEGGLAFAPTLAMVGDNRGAGSGNPEVIAPLNKLKSYLSPNNGTPNFMVSHRISGNDLLVVIENANNNSLRTAGRSPFAKG